MNISYLTQYLQQLEKTSSRLTMTELLADLFGKSDTKDIEKICYLLQGRVVARFESLEFGVADKLMIRAISRASNKDTLEIFSLFKTKGDLGEAASIFLVGKHHKKELKVKEVFDQLMEIAKSHGKGSQEVKIDLLSKLLSAVDNVSAKYIVRITLNKLRLGFSDMTILDSLSWMITNNKSLRPRLEDAYNVRPDIAFIASTVKEKGVNGLVGTKAKLGVPILGALCQRLPSADEMIDKMKKVGVEPKYDGVRVQIHYEKSKIKSKKSKVSSFSRNLENTTYMFPELTKIDSQVNAQNAIFDCEAVGVDTKSGRLLTFQKTTSRKRKHEIELFSNKIPIRFYVFDILLKNNQDLLQLPFSKRRAILESTVKKGSIMIISPQIITDKPKALRKYHRQQIKKGLEGAVVKKWESSYVPGRREFNWVKFKEGEGKTGKLHDTIDAVVMGYSYGQGKRSGFGIGRFLVGVRKGDSFVTVSKVGTGVSDQMWKMLKKKLTGMKTYKKSKQYINIDKSLTPDVWVDPQMVVEVAGDDLTVSSTHGAGYAIRFPRLVKIRADKNPDQTTTVMEIKKMYKAQ